MNLIDYIVNVFVMADDFCKIHFPARKLRTRGPLPKLADSEVIAMELVGEYLGLRTDEGIHHYFRRHWHHLFPNLPDRSNFARQCANVWDVKQSFFEYLSGFQDHYLQILDSMPIEVCNAPQCGQFCRCATLCSHDRSGGGCASATRGRRG